MCSESLIGFGADLASKKDDRGAKVIEKAEDLYKTNLCRVIITLSIYKER